MSTVERLPVDPDSLVHAAELVITTQYAAAANLARKLRIDPEQARGLLDHLEVVSIVEPGGAERTVLVQPAGLDAALARVREHAREHSTGAVAVEVVDDTPIRRGGFGDAEPHLGPYSPGAELVVRDDGTVAERAAGELAEADDGPDEAAPVTLVGRLMEPVHVITDLATSQEAKEVGGVVVGFGRVLLRIAVTTLQGYESAVKRTYSAATHGVLREQVRQARASHDLAAVTLAMTELKAAKKIRSDLLKDLPGVVLGILRLVVIGLSVVAGLLAVGGIVTWAFPGGLDWAMWWAGVATGLDMTGTVLRWVAWLLMWAAVPALLLLGYREGRRVGQAPRWLVTDDERAEMDSVIDERMVSRALANLGVSAINQFFKDGGMIEYIVPPRQVGEGTFTRFRTPPGSIANDIITRRDRFAGNLGRAPLEMWPTQGDEASVCDCWIADKGVLNKGAGEWPLLHDGVVDVFEGVPFGRSQRGEVVLAPLFENNWLIGGRPGQGKSNAARVLLLGAALDPTAELWVFVMGESPDFAPFEPRLSRYAMGMDDAVAAAALQALRDALTEMERRGKVLSAQPGGPPKTSRKLADKQSIGLHPLIINIDECHELFQHKEFGKEAEELAVRLIKRGRKYGIILLLETQSPTRDSIPREVTRNISCGVAYSVSDHVANDGLLGTGKYKLGIRATELRMNVDRGTCVTVGVTDNAFELIRTFYVPLEDGRDEVTHVIGRAMAGVKELRRTGQLAEIDAAPIDHLRDVWEVLREPREELRDVLPRLRDRDEETYRSWNQSRLIEFLEGEGVKVGFIKGYKTVLAADVETVIEERGGGGDDDDS